MKHLIALFILFFSQFAYGDEVGLSENWQLSFQAPATDLMSDVISFHSYILMPIVTRLIFTSLYYGAL